MKTRLHPFRYDAAMRNLSLLAAGALVLGAAMARSAAWQEPEVRTVAVGPGLSMLVGQGGNVGVLAGPEGLLVVDSQFERMAPALRKAMDGIQKGAEIRWLVNTHAHGDHTGGNAALGAQAFRMAHARVLAALQTPPAGREAAPAAGLPTLTWEDGVTLFANGQEVRIRHVGPAHTDGDSVLWFPAAHAVHLGDLLFTGMFPFIDLDGGGSVEGYLAALEEVHAALPEDWKVIPGHGALATRADLARSIQMIEATLAIVRERVAQGMTRAQVAAAGLPAEWDSWSWQFVPTKRWLETLARACHAKE